MTKIVKAYSGVTVRSVLAHAPGYAINDALCWHESSMYYSHAGLALAILDCAKDLVDVRPKQSFRFPRSWNRGLAIIEFGCGSGALGDLLVRSGSVEYVGIDGNALAGRFSPYIGRCNGQFLFLNLEEEIWLRVGNRSACFDAACSFEVLEHIQAARVDVFLMSVKRHLRPRGLFICSTSRLDGMDVHVTIRDRAWWLEQFLRFGLTEVSPDCWTPVIAAHHPWNWSPETSEVFVLRNAT